MPGDFISLSELHKLVRQVLKSGFPDTLWVTAEIASVQENRSGHCYLELAEKSDGEDKVLAVAKANIWSFVYGMLKSYFITETGRELEKGMKILVNVEIVFHEVYGLSLNIKDIDPTYTIGDLERKRKEILEQLESEGVIDMNKALEFPLLPKNIAVISSPTAAGYGDFINQLTHNAYGYKYHVCLFPAVMQGENTTGSIISALERIYEYEDLFDAVVIIRGGGSQTELGSFDSYELAANIAQFPLPVIAGIGHDRDKTIVDHVAYASVKTPTAAAAFLIEYFNDFATSLDDAKERVVGKVRTLLNEERQRQKYHLADFKRVTQILLENNRTRLKILTQKLGYTSIRLVDMQRKGFEEVKYRIRHRLKVLFSSEQTDLSKCIAGVRRSASAGLSAAKYKLELAETTARYTDPANVLERGYSITRLNGKAVKSTGEVKTGDIVETMLQDGILKSEIKQIEKI